MVLGELLFRNERFKQYIIYLVVVYTNDIQHIVFRGTVEQIPHEYMEYEVIKANISSIYIANKKDLN